MRRAVRAAPTRCAWRRRAPTSSRSTSARRSTRSTSIAASTPEDLAETADLVKGLDRRIVTAEVDVRDYDALKAAVDSGVEQFGRLDIIVANAGIGNGGQTLDKTSERDWTDMIDINLARRVEDRQSRCPAHPRGRPRRIDHPDQLGRRPQGLPALRPLRRRQARCRRH